MQSELLQKIEHDAARGNPCPKNLEPPEAMLYYMLVGVYASYQAGKITKEEGHEKKAEVYAVYNRMLTEYNQFREVCASMQQKIREGYTVSGVTIVPKEDNNE